MYYDDGPRVSYHAVFMALIILVLIVGFMLGGVHPECIEHDCPPGWGEQNHWKEHR